jgi:hypothetical protein
MDLNPTPRIDYITAVTVHAARLTQRDIGTFPAARLLSHCGVRIDIALRVLAQPASCRR